MDAPFQVSWRIQESSSEFLSFESGLLGIVSGDPGRAVIGRLMGEGSSFNSCSISSTRSGLSAYSVEELQALYQDVWLADLRKGKIGRRTERNGTKQTWSLGGGEGEVERGTKGEADRRDHQVKEKEKSEESERRNRQCSKTNNKKFSQPKFSWTAFINIKISRQLSCLDFACCGLWLRTMWQCLGQVLSSMTSFPPLYWYIRSNHIEKELMFQSGGNILQFSVIRVKIMRSYCVKYQSVMPEVDHILFGFWA